MRDAGYITFFCNRKETVVDISAILYCIMRGATAEIHTNGGTIYKTRMTFADIENKLGDNFIKIHRGCLVAALAMQNNQHTMNLSPETPGHIHINYCFTRMLYKLQHCFKPIKKRQTV